MTRIRGTHANGGTVLVPPLFHIRERLPVATAAVFVATATATAAHSFAPAVLDVLIRRPGALAAGEWWRLVTPMFVHDKGWSQIVINLAGIALAGAAIEWRLDSSRRWLALYFVPGVIGQAAAYFWYPEGGGASTGVSGLCGGVIVWLLRRDDAGNDEREGFPRAAAFYAVFLIASLVGRYAVNLGMIGGEIGGAVAACTALGVVFAQFRRRYPSPRATALFLGYVGVAGAVVLAALRDIHGPAVLAGMGIAAAFLVVRRRNRRGLTPCPETPR